MHSSPLNTTQKTAIVIGAGISGCATAYSLAKRDWQVTVIERFSHIAQAASGNARGVLYPRLASHNSVQDRLSLSSYAYTLKLLQALKLNEADFQAYGVLQLAFNARESARIHDIAQRHLAHDIVRLVSAAEASAIAGVKVTYPALYFAQAGWLNPPAFCHALMQHPNIQLVTNTDALSLQQQADRWQVHANTGLVAAASSVVIANANDALNFDQTRHFPMTPVRGQMTTVNATPTSTSLKTVLCTDGYITPAFAGQHCLGATFAANNNDISAQEADNQTNLAMLPTMSADLTTLAQQAATGRAALRCATPDYMPLVGALLDATALKHQPPKHRTSADKLTWHHGIYVNVGHGAKGLITAPLCAEILASAITGEPSPVDASLVSALQPNRFLLRDLGLKRLVTDFV
ncbi:MAG TPA: FAD-dependent 5-carboxymethylaminomethyl-2-thiouridine(34) oxidoreductase MnmC [Methylophilus sp.]